MRYAQIKNGKVVNIIICDNESLHLFSEGFDAVVEVGDCVNSAKIGQVYDQLTNTFSKPVLSAEQLARQAEKEAKKAADKAEFEAFKAWKASQ